MVVTVGLIPNGVLEREFHRRLIFHDNSCQLIGVLLSLLRSSSFLPVLQERRHASASAFLGQRGGLYTMASRTGSDAALVFDKFGKFARQHSRYRCACLSL